MLLMIIICSLFASHLTSTIALPSLARSSTRIFSAKSLKNMSSFTNELVMDAFCIRQFNNPEYTGTQVNYDVQEFENKVNEYVRNGYKLVDGYAPFWSVNSQLFYFHQF